MKRAFHDLADRRFWSFPRVLACTDGRPIHGIEQKIIREALLNAGASLVTFKDTVRLIDEQQSARAAYIQRAKRKK